MRFHDPQLLLLLFLLPPLAFLIRRRERRRPAFPFAGATLGAALPETLRCRLARALPYLRLPVLILLIAALARPQVRERETVLPSRGIDLMVALDLSSSMLAQEAAATGSLTPALSRGGRESAAAVRSGGEPENRLAMAKAVLLEFIKGRGGDRIGLIAFAARPYPAAPLTLDHAWLKTAVDRLQAGAIEDGTALGDALLAALNRLRDKPAASRAVILITDGRSNAGSTSPVLAAATAKALGIRVHTIGIGSRGSAVIPVASPLGGTMFRRLDLDLDETTLTEIARSTGGSYFRADDRNVLSGVFRQIDRLEKISSKERVFFSYRELYPGVILAALALLVLGLVLGQTVLRRLP